MIDKNLQRAQSLVGTSKGRPNDDFYPTPEHATVSLLEHESFPRFIWEPACGDGAISKILDEYGFMVYSSDLFDHGYGDVGVDFLDQNDASNSWSDSAIITNPPFSLAEKFLQTAIGLNVEKIALLCKLQFLEGQKRSLLLERTKLTRVHVFRKRLQLTRNGLPYKNGGMIAFAWFIWERGYEGKPEIDWI